MRQGPLRRLGDYVTLVAAAADHAADSPRESLPARPLSAETSTLGDMTAAGEPRPGMTNDGDPESDATRAASRGRKPGWPSSTTPRCAPLRGHVGISAGPGGVEAERYLLRGAGSRRQRRVSARRQVHSTRRPTSSRALRTGFHNQQR